MPPFFLKWLGDGKKFSYGVKEYTNGKLEYGTTYMVFQRVYVKEVGLLETSRTVFNSCFSRILDKWPLTNISTLTFHHETMK